MKVSGVGISIVVVLTILTSIAIAGLAIQVWLSPVPADQMSPAQNNLLTTADWMLKSSIGALLGFTGAVRLSARNGR